MREGSLARLDSEGRSCSRESKDVFTGVVYNWCISPSEVPFQLGGL